MAYENGIDTLEEYGANKKRLAEERQSLQEELDRVLTPAALPETISKEDFRKEIKNINDILKNPEEPAEKKSANIYTRFTIWNACWGKSATKQRTRGI